MIFYISVNDFSKYAYSLPLNTKLGSLFVVKRSSTPRFQMIVMNRNSKNNLVVPLAKKFQMQVREPYLIFRFNTNDKAPQRVRGIWFHDDKERNKIVQILDKAVKSLSMTVEEPVAPKTQTVDKTEAAASLMAALKIGGSNQTAQSASEPKSQPQRQPQTQAQEPNVQNMVLDKKSLQLSLMSLLQEDKFLDIIHAQYVKVAKARAASGNQK